MGACKIVVLSMRCIIGAELKRFQRARLLVALKTPFSQRDCCVILAKNGLLSALDQKILPEDKLKNFVLMELAEEISRKPNID